MHALMFYYQEDCDGWKAIFQISTIINDSSPHRLSYNGYYYNDMRMWALGRDHGLISN